MGCCEQDAPPALKTELTLALAGNPNCGKSALFNLFTGIRQKTGNWPGVTVERKQGWFALTDARKATLIDLPGIYSLDANSLDEEVTRDYLLGGEADLIVNVVDATNLERNLYLTVQLLEMGVPLVLVVNMMDVARKRGIEINIETLSEELGCPVIPLVATTGEGLDALRQAILSVMDGQASGGFRLAQGEQVEQAVLALEPGFADIEDIKVRHWLALKLLEGDSHASAQMRGEITKPVQEWQAEIEQRCGEPVDIHIADSRFAHAHALAQQVVTNRDQIDHTISDRIDRVVLNRFLGVPLFFVVMYLMFLFTINIGGAFVDFFDMAVGAVLVDGLGHWLTGIGAPDWLSLLLATGIGGGIQVVATFIPIIASLYLVLSVLEDTGYMARAAFVMDRAMRRIGLPGKAFVPLIVGFGCNVPAVMATRTLENERERKLTILMNPFMSCGARLPVYALFAAAFFPHNGQNLVFLLYLTGIAIAVLTGLIMKKTLLSGESTGFMMELPSYHRPTLRGVLLRTWDRVRLFIKEAGQVIVVMVLAINLLGSIGADGSLNNQDSEHSLLSELSRQATPLFAPMGIQQDNWPATLGIFTGVLAKEVVVGTLDAIYTQLAEQSEPAGQETENFSVFAALMAALATIPQNLSELGAALTDPLGLDVGDISSTSAAAEAQEVNEGLFGAMAQRFDGQAGAVAFLLFILLYSPCVATIGAIVREAGAAWAAFVVAWTTTIAYVAATLYYQLATFAQHPAVSLYWTTGLLTWMAAIIVGLRIWSRREATLITAEKVAA